MAKHSLFMAIVPQEQQAQFCHDVSVALGYSFADIVIGSPRDGISALAVRAEPPRHIFIDIGEKGPEILPEIDALAEHCHAGTRVVVLGSVNDVRFYRDLRSRGVLEYFTRPAAVADVKAVFQSVGSDNESGGKVIAFMSAASGDGASTIALNTAYALATEYQKSVVLVDMDYQFGMVAKNLDLTAPFGIKELFDHPERGIDATLIKRMTVGYATSRLKIIAAPNPLHPIPEVRSEAIHDLIKTLKQEYDMVIIDLPHIWTPWVSSTLSMASRSVLVAQLWLRSVTHCSRLLSVWRAGGVEEGRISLVVNRSGAKFKEAVSARDFERVCGLPIKHNFVNDIRSVISAENLGKTLLESGNSAMVKQIKEFAGMLVKD